MLQSVHVLHNTCGSGPCAFWMLQKGYLAEQSSGRFCRMGNAGFSGAGTKPVRCLQFQVNARVSG